MQAVRREETSSRPKVVKVTVQMMTALFKGKQATSFIPATLVVTDAGESILRAAPTTLKC